MCVLLSECSSVCLSVCVSSHPVKCSPSHRGFLLPVPATFTPRPSDVPLPTAELPTLCACNLHLPRPSAISPFPPRGFLMTLPATFIIVSHSEYYERGRFLLKPVLYELRASVLAPL